MVRMNGIFASQRGRDGLQVRKQDCRNLARMHALLNFLHLKFLGVIFYSLRAEPSGFPEGIPKKD